MESLHWKRVGGSGAGVFAEYGDWQFRVYLLGQKRYQATAWNTLTRESRQGQLPSQAEGRRFCERIYARLRDEDRQ